MLQSTDVFLGHLLCYLLSCLIEMGWSRLGRIRLRSYTFLGLDKMRCQSASAANVKTMTSKNRWRHMQEGPVESFLLGVKCAAEINANMNVALLYSENRCSWPRSVCVLHNKRRQVKSSSGLTSGSFCREWKKEKKRNLIWIDSLSCAVTAPRGGFRDLKQVRVFLNDQPRCEKWTCKMSNVFVPSFFLRSLEL